MNWWVYGIILWSVIAERSQNTSRVKPSRGIRGCVGQVEISHLGHKVIKQQDIARPHVPMDYWWLDLLVKELKPFGCSIRDLDPLVPVQHRSWLSPLDTLSP